ncbi:MAG: YfhO family protein [Bacteroidetes bacterium]|nr:YfhO family protein [Bacteroidota bacterium]
MTNPKKEKSAKKPQETPIIPSAYQHSASIFVLLLSLIVFFHELVFDGRVFLAADNIASKSFQTLVADAESQNIFPLWNPYIFGGMPGYASLMVHGERYFDITALLINRASTLFGAIINSPDVGWGLFYYWLLGIGIYWFVFEKLKSKVAALVAALAVMHSTFIVILVMVGHMTKVPVIAFFPFIFMLLERLREKITLVSFLALIMLVHFMLLPGHIQMIFYCYLAFGLYYLFFLVRSLISGSGWQGILRSGLVFSAATVLAFAMTGDQYLSTLEYSKYSMRGADAIVPSAQQQAQGNTNGGLDYEYATNWSFSPGEIVTFFIPSSHGFGWHQYKGVLSQGQEMRLNTYSGNMPFTDAPQYMGIVVLVLAGIGFWRNRKDAFVQYTGLLILLSLLVSFGKELPFAYDLMFNYFPMFNKFRIPSMVLILVQIMVPVLAAYGIVTLMKDAENKDARRRQQLLYTVGGFGVLFILSMVGKDLVIGIYELFFSPQETMNALARNYGTNQQVLAELYNVIAGMVAADVVFAALFLSVVLGTFLLFHDRKVTAGVLTVIMVVIVLADLWRVNAKPMDAKPRTETAEVFTTPSYVSFMKQDTSLYRVLEFENGQPPYNNTLAYWRIQSAYGYSGTKMRQVQDLFDVAGLGNPLVWGLMNVRYILSDRQDSNSVMVPVFAGQGRVVHYNRTELPRAFFVNRYEVATGLEILNKIKGMEFNPMDVAYVMDDPGVKIQPPGSGAKAEYIRYGIQDLALKVTATGDNLLFLSEAWYPEGWKAYIDDVETPIHRVNYMFRGVVVPAGEHVLTMKFEPTGFVLGRSLSLGLNLLVVIGLLVIGGMSWRQRKNTNVQ